MNRSAIPRKPKTCKCKVCKSDFIVQRMGQKVCGRKCAQEFARIDREKKEADERRKARAEDRKRKEEMKTRSDWIKEAQVAFNTFIRERDKDQPCICCGKPLGVGEIGGGYDCGHYRSVGSAPHLRFDERNAHAQRKQCNRYGAGRAVDYRIGLIGRLGLAAVEALEADQTQRKWTIEDLKAIKAEYKAKLKTLLMERGGQ